MPTGFSTEVETKPFMIERLLRYYPSYALQWIVRCSDAQAIETLNRGNLLYISREEACDFFDQLIGACEAGLKSEAGRFFAGKSLEGLVARLGETFCLVDSRSNGTPFRCTLCCLSAISAMV